MPRADLPNSPFPGCNISFNLHKQEDVVFCGEGDVTVHARVGDGDLLSGRREEGERKRGRGGER